MSRKVALISLNRYTSPDAVFPLALAHLNSALRRAGYDTRWLDCQLPEAQLERDLTSYGPDYVGISLRNIDDVVIRTRETFFGDLLSVTRRVREIAGCPVIVGGSGFSIFPRELLRLTEADYGVSGEGEVSLVALLQALESKTDPSGIPGLVFRRRGEIIVNPQGTAPAVSELEPADWPKALVDHYLKASGMLNVQTQRGCSFHCCYCTYPIIEGRTHRSRLPEVIAREMQYLASFGAKYLFIVDSVFNSSPAHVIQTCEAILHSGVQLPWGCFLRPVGLTPELMRLMRRAGLRHIEFGSDSFCDSVLEEYGKSFQFEDVLRSSALAHEQKIDYCHFLICGGPGERMETLQTTFENSRRLPQSIVMAVVGMRIYPGTALFQRAQAEGVLPAGADLLEPQYYLAPELTEERVFTRLREFARACPTWVIGDPSPGYLKLAQRLRQRGVVGPLWSYYAALQRLWPGPASQGAA